MKAINDRGEASAGQGGNGGLTIMSYGAINIQDINISNVNCPKAYILCLFNSSITNSPIAPPQQTTSPANTFFSDYRPTAIIIGGNGGIGVGDFSVVGAERVWLLKDLSSQRFGYSGRGSGAGEKLTPYGGVVFNLDDFDSYQGPFITYNLTVQPYTISYFHDEKKWSFQPGTVQGFAIGGPAEGLSASATYTDFQKLILPEWLK